jgi:hypothetical protein
MGKSQRGTSLLCPVEVGILEALGAQGCGWLSGHSPCLPLSQREALRLGISLPGSTSHCQEKRKANGRRYAHPRPP